ncbi:survival of motor neuron-related-splicing factor 30 [Chlorella sorokiniana]|uniref:Survival of motor neuron-related-splicing factor 30 n=1 Tax=Chlorella sorokiniana TaxID=3076 RepID=A0A2P6TDP2_CHLSO|nr:survival of motor neuron-related-splicing factor 30 [Chlorella sorokiniana]|eukprot:PRW20751.1 survival of motor neuron-related-splicing factor 30 [Chlorella sorokiniana]
MSDQEVAHAAEELASNLASYERQLAEVEELLLEDPENSELQAIFDNLTEVIQLAQELCQYDAVVEAPGHAGTFVVVFEGYGTQEEVGKDAIQLRGAEDDAGYRGVAAPKRRRVDDNVEVQEMPKWLQIKDSDDDKTRQKKRKLAKAYKSKARFARLDLQQKEKADAWKRFIAGKPKKGRATRQTAD